MFGRRLVGKGECFVEEDEYEKMNVWLKMITRERWKYCRRRKVGTNGCLVEED